MKSLALSVLGLLFSLMSFAQKDLVVHYDFSEKGIESQLKNGATIEKCGKLKVLNLGDKDGYFDLTEETGKALKSLNDFTISVFYKVSSVNQLKGNGFFLFAFSDLAENKANEGPYTAFRLNQQRFETSTGGWDHEEIIMKNRPADKDVWIHMLYRQTGHSGELYLNGELVGTNEKMPILSENFKDAPKNCWIGKAPFHGDNYLRNTLVADFSIYNRALTDKEVQKIISQKMKLK